MLTVPVTKDLNAKLTGFLPVHCVHQLLKSRVFSKHRVDVKVDFNLYWFQSITSFSS